MSKSIRTLVAFGDCNTAGIAECRGNAYPELVAKALGCPVRNLGHTMSTTRELLQYARALSICCGMYHIAQANVLRKQT